MTRLLRYSLTILGAALVFGTIPKAAAQCDAKFVFSKTELTVTFTDSSKAQNAWQRIWNFGDGTKSDGKAPKHIYAKPGSYRVCLYINDTTAKCKDSFCETVTVKQSCKAEWTFSVSGKTVTLKADSTVNKSTARYRWKFGDGSSAVMGKTTSHTYANNGEYEVCLTVIDSPCEVTTCKKVVIGTPKYCISGKIDCKGDPAYPGKVWLIVFDRTDSSLKAVMDGPIKKDSTGKTYYEFCNVPPGTYYVKAALDTSSPKYSDYLPTYFESAFKWKHADSIRVTNANVIGRNIHMKKGNNPGGPGFIKGKISQGANKNEGDPLEDIEVMLLDNGTGEPLGYTYTNADGEYSFTSIPYGTYQIYPEVLGLPTFPAIVTISAAAQGAEGVDLKINSRQVYAATAIYENKPSDIQALNLYPNPAGEMLFIPITSELSRELSISVFDAAGRKVYRQTIRVMGGDQTLTIPVGNLGSGLYTVQIITAGNNPAIYQSRFMKN